MDCKFKRGGIVTWIGRREIGTVADVLHAPGTEPPYSIKSGNVLRWA
jgi:hypothetical protein